MFKKIWIITLSAFLSTAVSAGDAIFGTAYGTELPLIWSSIVTLSGGAAWANPGQNQYFYPELPPPFIEQYRYNSPTGILASAEIFFGLQRIIYPGIIGELGIGLAGTSDIEATGVVDVGGIPNVNDYSYKVNHGRVEFKGKLISNYFNPVQPYISGSLGAGFNNSHAYVPTTINPILYPTSWFAANTSMGFAYTVGLGLQTKLNPSWQVGVGYEFADLGKNGLGPDTSFIVNKTLQLTHLYTHEVLFSLSYLFSTP